jgi:solute carrier family 50 protein (sugar transporter)
MNLSALFALAVGIAFHPRLGVCAKNFKFKVEESSMADGTETVSFPFLSTILHTAGPVLFIALQASCLMVAVDIINMKSVKKLSSVPFASLLANGVLWTAYGWLKTDSTIYLPNMLSIAVAIFCMAVYYQYALVKPYRVYAASLFVCSIGIWLVSTGDSTSIGLLGCALSVLMSGSPLAVISTVIREQSTAALPFWTSLVTWFNTLSWVLYGLWIAHDNMIIVPNTLGLVLASAQMLLFAFYGMPPHAKGTEQLNAKRSGSDTYVDNPYDV